MSDQLIQDQDKVDEYFRVLQDRILAPIQNPEIQSYCTATLLLLFSAIDGLGKLLHPHNKAGVRERILGFLDYMGGNYKVYKDELYNLRKSLVHNAINVASYLSKNETVGDDQHLRKIGTAGYINVNTLVMYEDFVVAFKRFSSEIKHDPVLRKSAADRLKWMVDDPLDGIDIPGLATPSPPPRVKFIHVK